MAYVYVIRRKDTDRAYIGSTADVKRRWKEHRRLLDAGRHYCTPLLEDWAQFGEVLFEWQILEVCDERDMVACEASWLRTQANGYYNRYTHPRTLWQNLAFRELMKTRAQERVRTPQGRAQLKDARANRKDYSMMASVRAQVKVVRNQYPRWKDDEEAFLLEHYGKESARAIAEQLGRPYQAVLVRANRLGLKSKGSAGFSERMRRVSLEREVKIATDPEARKKRSQNMSQSAKRRYDAQETPHALP